MLTDRMRFERWAVLTEPSTLIILRRMFGVVEYHPTLFQSLCYLKYFASYIHSIQRGKKKILGIGRKDSSLTENVKVGPNFLLHSTSTSCIESSIYSSYRHISRLLIYMSIQSYTKNSMFP